MIIPSKFIIQRRSNNESFTGNPKHKNLTCNYCHNKRHIRSERWLRKKKQPDANITELVERDEEQCDVLSVTDRPVGNKNRWVIDSGCSQHISSNRKMFSLYTSVQEGEVSVRNSPTGKVIDEGTIQFRSHDGCITTLEKFVMFPNQGTISSLLESYIEKSYVSVQKVILWKFQRGPCDVSSRTCR